MAYGVAKSETQRLRSEALDYLRCISLAKAWDPRRAKAKRDKAGSRARKNRTKDQKTEQKLDDQKGGKVQRPLDTLMAVSGGTLCFTCALLEVDGEKLAVSVSA